VVFHSFFFGTIFIEKNTMAELVYLNGTLYNVDTAQYQYVVFYTTDWSRPQMWAIDNGLQLRGLNLITSTMDIKAAYASTSYRLNFKDKLANVTENYYVFSDDFKQVQLLVDQQAQKGYILNTLTRLDQTFVDLTR